AGGGAPAEPTVTLDVKDVPFWQVLDQVLDQVGLTVDITATDEGKPLHALAVVSPLAPQTPRAKRANYSGALRFEPIMVTSRRGLADPEASDMQIVIEAAWEPRLAPITLSYPRESLSVKLDDGRELKSAREGVETITVRGSGVRFTMHTDLPARSAHVIQKASGRLNVLVPGRDETFRCGPLAAGFKSREKKGGVTVSVDRVARNGDGWEIGLRLKFDNPAGALQSHLLDWVNDNETWLETSDGKKIESGSYESTRQEEDEYGISYIFPLTGDIKGCTFVYRTPAALVEKSIPFELKNIELP
ncbi:MAG: hypothetical protein K8T25_23115, partial [Planctomycetia bacterium]|nr:hypothetical protein [Planctomycetia bacterium]